MYILLSGAKKNLGDYLITERATKLLERFKPGCAFEHHPAWKPLDPDRVRAAKAIVILGGPGYQPGFYPKIYPLVADVRAIACPIIPLGMGWKGIPGDEITLKSYRFTPESLAALQTISQRTRWLGCRDVLTVRVLKQAGLTNALLTGCPVWYDLASFGRAMRLPERVQRLVFTPAQVALFAEQSIAVARVLVDLFPRAEKICAFHRGIDENSEWTKPEERENNRRIADAASAMGFDVRDVSGDLSKVDFYDTCDFHVGYRVHAHIQFLSQRLPSLLLHEDGRGIGASETLELRGITAFERPIEAQVAGGVPGGGPAPWKRLRTGLVKRYRASNEVAEQVRGLLELDVATGFARYAGVGARIDAHLPTMQRFIEAIP